MAIIANMKVPDSCESCPCCSEGIYSNSIDCNILHEYITNNVAKQGKPKNCPLKSADEMIAEIQNLHITDTAIKLVSEVINKYSN